MKTAGSGILPSQDIGLFVFADVPVGETLAHFFLQDFFRQAGYIDIRPGIPGPAGFVFKYQLPPFTNAEYAEIKPRITGAGPANHPGPFPAHGHLNLLMRILHRGGAGIQKAAVIFFPDAIDGGLRSCPGAIPEHLTTDQVVQSVGSGPRHPHDYENEPAQIPVLRLPF